MKATNTLYQEENNMKVFYLAQVNFGCVVYADNKNDAFEKIKCQRKELLETLGLPLDITRWGIVEFTPDLYDVYFHPYNMRGCNSLSCLSALGPNAPNTHQYFGNPTPIPPLGSGQGKCIVTNNTT